MKKALCFLLALLCLALAAQAKPAFGLRAGLNLASAKISPNEGMETKIKAAVILCFVGEVVLNRENTLAVRTSLGYAQKGWTETYPYSDIHWKFMVWVDEIVLAPNVVLKFPNSKFMPYLQAGPELGISIDARTREEYMTDVYNDEITYWANTNIGANFGGGLGFKVGKGELLCDVVYNLGLKNMYTDDHHDEYSIKTNGIQLTLGYLFSVPTK